MGKLKEGLGVETRRESGRLVKVIGDLKPAQERQLAFEARLLSELGLESVEVGQNQLTRPYLEGPTLAELPLPLPSLEPFVHLLRTLEKAHAHGVLHLNLRPENLVLTPPGLQPIDFLVPRFARVRGELRQLEPRAVHFLAPEVAGLIRTGVGPEADLYSVGALLHLALTGQPPYSGATASEVLRAHLMAPLPGESPLVRTLLARPPAERYRSAREARLALEDVIEGRPPRGASPGELSRPAFVSREAELAQLEEASGWSLVVGEAGLGKSRLLDELMLRVQRRGGLVLHSRATARPEPLQLFAGLAPELAARADWQALRPRLGFYRSVLAGAFPEWTKGLQAASSTAAPGVLAAALARLVHSLGEVWLVLDDLHWADSVSLEALARLAADPPPQVRIVAAARPFPWAADRTTLALAPLSPAGSRELLESMAGGLSLSRREDLCELAQGRPLLLVEGLRASWGRAQVSVGDQAAELLQQRLEGMASPALAALAVLGPAPAGLVDQLTPGALARLERARCGALLWRDSHGNYHFAHEKLREAVLERLAPGERAAWHARAADLQDDPGSAALHWHAAGQSERARPLALEAARASQRRFDHDTALKFYALAGEESLEVASCLRLAGRRREALDLASRCEADTPLERARLLYLRGQAEAGMDRLVEARELLRAALDTVAVKMPPLPPWYWLDPCSLPQADHESPGVELALRISQELVEVYSRTGRLGSAVGLMLRAVNLAARHRRLPQAVVALAEFSPFQLFFGLPGAALRTAQKARGLARGLEDYTRARAIARASMVDWGRPPVTRAIRIMDEARSLVEATSSDAFEVNTLRFSWSLFGLAAGRLAEVRALAEEMLLLARELNDSLYRGCALALLVQASGTLPDQLLDDELLKPPTSFLQQSQLQIAAALRALRRGDPAAAARCLEFDSSSWQQLPMDLALLNRWRATVYRLAAEASSSPADRASFYRRARRAVRAALQSAPWLLVTQLAARREAGLLAAARGHTARARHLLDEAVAFAVKCEARFEEAQSRQAWGQVGLPLGWPGAARELEAGRHALRQLGATWLLESEPAAQDPLESTLSWGRRLASEPALEPVALAELAPYGVERFITSIAAAAKANREREALQDQARQALRRQETELRALIAAVGVVVTDGEGKVVEVNDTFRRWVGPDWQGPVRTGEWLLETPGGRRLLSRWTASGRLYTVTLVEDLGKVTAAQEASWKAREARLERFRGALQKHEPQRLNALAAPDANFSPLWERLGLPVEVSNRLPERLPPLTGRTLRRLLQESLTNVRRHSQAERVVIELGVEAGWLSARVSDDGVGFDPLQETDRLGLRGMLWRARFAGGDCQLESAPGKGTTVRIRLPL